MTYVTGNAGLELTARLITRPTDAQVYTLTRECDSRSAMIRGLCDYLAGLSIVMPGGRDLAFVAVRDEWAEPEEDSGYPAACVTAEREGTYESTRFTPGSPLTVGVEHQHLFVTTDHQLDITVHYWSTDPPQRQGIACMLEDAFCPVDWMHGIKLELPFYYNERATYGAVSNQFINDEDSAMKRHLRGQLRVIARLPVLRQHVRPLLRPEVRVTVTESGDEATGD
jgi:hypothetical protein